MADGAMEIKQKAEYIGRRKIYCPVDLVTRENVISVVNQILSLHTENMLSEE